VTKEKFKNPPKLAEWILSCVYPDRGDFTSVGDFREEYLEVYQSSGPFRANLWYWMQIAKSIPSYIRNRSHWSIVMIHNYLKIALRNIKRHKGYTFINIFGLAIGIASCILILLWVSDELSFDRFHVNIHHLFRVTRSESTPDGSLNHFASTPSPLAPSLKESYPEIIESTRFYNISQLKGRILLEANHQKYYESDYCFADPSFFSMFTFYFVQGDPQSALRLPNSVVLTQEMAIKYFGADNPIGKTVSMNNGDAYTISGVIKNVPGNSHLKFDFISPIEPLFDRYAWMRRWNIPHFYTYVLLDERADVRELNEKIQDHLKQSNPDFFKQSNNHYFLQPVKDIHLHSNLQSDMRGSSTSQSRYIIVFSAIAVVVLIIASINFINLTTSHSSNRAKEIGVRKVNGAARKDIAQQFFCESLVMSLISLGLALFLAIISLPAFNELSGKKIDAAMMLNAHILCGIAGIALITGFVSGIYPALFLSSFQPVAVLKGLKFHIMKNKDVRHILVIVQFSISLILIIGTVVVYSQMTYIQNRNLGFNKECLISFTKQGRLTDQYDAFKDSLLKKNNILGVTTSSDLPTMTRHYTMVGGWEGSSPEDGMLMNYFSVDEDYLETFGIEMAEGRFFSKEFSTDASEGFVLNEEAIKRMNVQDPIGKRFSFYGREGRIIGVIKNFHFESLHHAIEPLILWINPRSDQHIFVRIEYENIAENIRFIEEAHSRFNPEYPFNFKFLDMEIDKLYRKEIRTKRILQIFAGFAIFISCIGLYGLVSYAAQRRTKEIGIRKVLGASVLKIYIMLSREFVRWVILANFIAWPGAYYFMNKWLQNFAFRISLSVWFFILPGFMALVIALLTVSYQSVKAATANPVESLRYE
jgi:ABC-type antimicrobial peptide transport system permease subunit